MVFVLLLWFVWNFCWQRGFCRSLPFFLCIRCTNVSFLRIVKTICHFCQLNYIIALLFGTKKMIFIILKDEITWFELKLILIVQNISLTIWKYATLTTKTWFCFGSFPKRFLVFPWYMYPFHVIFFNFL